MLDGFYFKMDSTNAIPLNVKLTKYNKMPSTLDLNKNCESDNVDNRKSFFKFIDSESTENLSNIDSNDFNKVEVDNITDNMRSVHIKPHACPCTGTNNMENCFTRFAVKCPKCHKINTNARRKSWCLDSPIRKNLFRDSFTDGRRPSWDRLKVLSLDYGSSKPPTNSNSSNKSLVNQLDQKIRKLCSVGKAMTVAHPSDRRAPRPSIFDSGRFRVRRISDTGVPLTLSSLKAKRKSEFYNLFDALKSSRKIYINEPDYVTQEPDQNFKTTRHIMVENARNIFNDEETTEQESTLKCNTTEKDKVEQTLGLLQVDLVDSETTEKCQEDLTNALTHHLSSFGDKLSLSKDNLEDTAKCYLLLDKAYEWALQAMKVVDALKATGVASPEQVSQAAKTVSTYLEENPPVPLDAFEAMIAIATKFNNHTLLQQCKVAQARCCDTASLLKNRHSALLKARRQLEFDWQSFVDLRELMGGAEDFSPLCWLSNSTLNNSGRRKSVTSLSSRSRDPLSRCSSLDIEDDATFSDPQVTSTPNKQTLESRTSLGNIKELRESAEDLQSSSCTSIKSATNSQNSGPPVSSGHAFSSGSSTCSSSESFGPVSGDRLLNKSHSWQYHKTSSQITEDCPDSLLDESLSPISNFSTKSYVPPSTTNSHLLIRGSQINLSNTEDLTEEEIKRNKTLLLIMQELKQTEIDYVNSLEYIIENYIPELMRDDIPQALRGQRNVIFGNIEKIFEFHSNFFLGELESCQKRPFSVGSVFLKFEKQFYLYALYNKNKPKSDSLMSEYGSSFFRAKQIELGDKMDLSSYLLKPVQRMGKYALLLKQLLKDCSRGEEGHEELNAAQEMVQFQLRHGNDLLAMDSLRDCDVNLKEQGRLLRQGELMVAEGNRKKSIRHVFLFEDLILFSKSRRDPEKKNLEIFQYKCSMKMTDIGMTEQVGESSNKFEIWFRKRKPSDTFVLHAVSVDLKESWTEVISKVLWRQALKNRSQRLHEMSSMGIGNKPCLDIRPSEDQICERSVSINQRGSARFKPTIPYMENLPNRRPHSVISIASSGSTGGSSSNSSSTGPTFVGTLNLGFEPGDSPRPLTRSVTRTSQCSAESGIMADIYSEKESDRHYKVERSNSSVTTISGDSVLSPVNSLVTYVTPPSTFVHANEVCQLVKDRSTGSLLTTEV